MEKEEKLEKSVVTPLTKTAFPWTHVLAIALAFSLVANLLFGSSWSDELRWRKANFAAWNRAKAEKEDLERELKRLRADVSDTAGWPWSYGLTSDVGRVIYRTCRQAPPGLLVAPELLFRKAGDEIAFDNPAPLVNDAGTRFLPGQRCTLASDTGFRVWRERGVYLIRFELDGSYGNACPTGTYVMVGDDNHYVSDMIGVACLREAKALEMSSLGRRHPAMSGQ